MECIPPFPHPMPPGLPTATMWPAGESTCPNQPCSPASHHFPPVLELHPPTLGKCPGSYVLWSTAGSRPSRLHFPLLPSLSLQHHTPLPGVSPQGALVGLLSGYLLEAPLLPGKLLLYLRLTSPEDWRKVKQRRRRGGGELREPP